MLQRVLFTLISIIFTLTHLAQAELNDTLNCEKAFDENSQFVLNEFEICLKSGVRLEIHGVVNEQFLSVATFRSSKNFFVFKHISLVGATPQIREKIFSLNRHDSVIVKGERIDNNAPQLHILAFELQVDSKSKSSEELKGYPYEAKIPTDLANQTRLTGLVHAVFAEGRILVIEYKDAVLPVFVDDKLIKYTRDLFRNDIIEMNYTIQRTPRRPAHLALAPTKGNAAAVRVIEAMEPQHGQFVEYTGELALFPKSPQVQFNVFALRREMANGLRRYYTLVNFENPQLFLAIRDKLQKAWDPFDAFKIKDRNKWRNPKVLVKAKGPLNVQDPNQANPQILINSINDIQIINP